MDVSRKSHFHFSIIFSLLGVLFLAATALYLSGTLSTITTAIIKPKASSAVPAITQSLVDNFNTGSIRAGKWQTSAPAGTQVSETASDNLRFDLSSGNDKKGASLIYKDVFKDKADFRIDLVAYRPIVTGAGSGIEGFRFNSTGATDKEGAVVRWIVTGNDSTIQFIVTDKDGKVKVNQSQPLVSNIAILRLVRVNTEYRAAFKAGNDYSADLNWTALGVCDETPATSNCASNLKGQDGTMSIFATNNGTNKPYPKVVARFDQARIGWEVHPTSGTPTPPPPPTSTSFSDAFNTGKLGSLWVPNQSAGVVTSESQTDNLMINIPAGAVNNHAAAGTIKRVTPVIGVDKNFSYSASMFKPVLTGDGTGFAGIAFASSSVADLEAASVRWYVTKSGSTVTSRLVFLVSDRNGGPAIERASAVVNNPKLTLTLKRVNNKYTAWYRTGDADTNLIQIGNVAADNTLGEDGNLFINASNIGTNKKFPRIVAQVDDVSASIQK